jgi:hypothetical protein
MLKANQNTRVVLFNQSTAQPHSPGTLKLYNLEVISTLGRLNIFSNEKTLGGFPGLYGGGG